MDNFHFSFELERFKFNSYGGGDVSGKDGDSRKKMIIIVMCFI